MATLPSLVDVNKAVVEKTINKWIITHNHTKPIPSQSDIVGDAANVFYSTFTIIMEQLGC